MSNMNKRILLILAILCIFIIIPCSFASDENDTAILTDSPVADENSIYVSLDGNDDTGLGTEVSPYQSISKAVEKFDSSKNSNIYVKNGTYTFNDRVTLNKAVTIVGESNNGVILDGNHTSGIFEVDTARVAVLISGISIINGYSDGAAVVVDSDNFVADNCIFENNDGGAITSSGGFSDWYPVNIHVKNSQFINNSVLGSGAAINIGAIYASLNVTDCVFINNSASGRGGAISLSNIRKDSSIVGSKFIGNNATTGSAVYMGNGHNLNLYDNEFIKNNASSEGAAVDLYANQYGKVINLNLKNNTFTGNAPTDDFKVEGMEIVYLDKNVRISGVDIETMDVGSDVNFTVTLTDANGNPISGKEITITFTDTIKRVNSYTAFTNESGQAVISLANQTAGIFTVVSSFAGDSSLDAINATNSVKIKAEHSYNFVFNETIVKVKAGDSYKVMVYICDEYIRPVYSGVFGDYEIKWDSRITTGYLSNSIFEVDVLDFDLSTRMEYYYINFTAHQINNYEVTAVGTLIIDTSIPLPPVDKDIEVIYVAKDGSDESGDGTEENPLATVQTALYVNEIFGGNKTIYVKEGTYDVSNYELYANATVIGEKSKTIFRQSVGDDGMLYLDNGATARFINITFTNGYMAEYTLLGAVIVIRYPGSVAYFDGCEFYDNRGSSDGIIYVAANSVAYFDNCIFKDNYAWTFNSAGVIQVYDAYLSVNNSYFENNTASEGAGIFVGGDAYANIENTVFYQNKALNDSYAISGGGAIYVNNWNTHITNCSFIENYADINGGAIYILVGKVEIEKCLFENNRVQPGSGKGSAIASDSGYTVLLYVDHSVLISDDYSKMIAIVNDLAEENEIIINDDYWGTSLQTGTKSHVIIQANASSDDIREGDRVEITVEFKDNSGNDLTKPVHDFALNVIPQLGSVDVDSITIINNTAKFNYFADKIGNENIIFQHGQTLYTYKFTVNALDINKKDLNVNISVNDNKTQITVEVPQNFVDNITIKVDTNTYSVKANDSVANLDIDEMPGKHTVQVSYGGNYEYKAFISDVFNFTIDKYDINLNVFVNNTVAGEDIVVDVTANDKFSGKVSVIINKKTHTVNVNNGKGSTTVNSLHSGNYTAEAIFEGNDYFNDDKVNTTFEVKESFIDVIYVSSNGSDDNFGTELSPYATISKALDVNKRLGGNRTIIVSEGNYVLNRYAITNDVSIVGEGDVVISQNAGTNHLYIGGNVNVNLEGLTFINGVGVQSGSIETGSDDAGNIGKILTITGCNFVNNTGAVGAITSYATTTISKSSFINNTGTGKDGFNQAIISIQDNAVDLKNNIFLNNNYANEIIVSRVAGNANDNFWGSNAKPGDVDKRLNLTTWVCVVPVIDEDVRAKTNYDLAVKFQSTNGVNFTELDNAMPNLTVNVDASLGEVSPADVLISDNVGISNYIVNQKGDELIKVDLYGKTIATVEFTVDVPEADKIYVSVKGNDSNIGSKDSPLATIKEALAQNKANGGNKTIVLLEGQYTENDLVIDTLVTILGENATINGKGGNVFTISADAEIAYITFADADAAIKQVAGKLYIYETEFTNNANALVANGHVTVENATFAENDNAIVSNLAVSVDNCEFSNNTGTAVSVANTSMIANSKFTGNGNALKLEESSSVIENNTFKNNGVAIDALKTDAVIKNNSFSAELIMLNESGANLVENANVTIKLINSNITNAVVSFIEAKTIIVDNGTIELNATVSDNMGNIIDGGKITFTSNGDVIGTTDVENGVAILKYPFTKGNYTISGTFGADKDAIVTDGLVRVDVDYYWFIGEVGYENLSDAINAAELGDVIKGIPGVYNVAKLPIGHRYMPIEPWEVLKSITITSMNDTPVTLKGSGVQMFFVDVGSELTLKNLIIRDAGSVDDDGGAVETLYNTNLTIINCTFTNNNGGDGGAVYAIGNTVLEIRDTVFDSNTGLLAGALQVVAYGMQDITLKNLTFTNNRAHYAGAFYNGGADLEMSDCKFINNTASVAGALYTNGGSITVTESEFISNKAIVNDAVTTTAMGGAVHNLLGDATFRNVKFIDNYAEGLGGAMELENGYYGTISWTIIDNCTFENNSARDGGAIYLGETYDPYVKITSSVFDSNVASGDGAAIYDNCGHVTVDGTKFINNKAGSLDVIHVIGEMVESTVYSGEFTLTKSEFANSDAEYVIFTNAYGVVKVSDSKVDSQKMFIFNRGESTIQNTVVTNSTDKVIENLGKLSLSGNEFDTPILNEKEIRSVTYVVVLDNQTQMVADGENYTLKATVVDDNNNIIEGGNLIFIVSGKQISAVYENNEFSANYTVNGTQTVDAIYDDDGLTQLKVKTATLIAKTPSDLSCVIDEAKVGSDAVITVNINPQASGNVTVTVGNKTYDVPISRGVAKLSVPGLAAGEYPVEISYAGDDKFAPAKESSTLVVSKVDDYEINVDTSKMGDDISINLILPSDANGKATVVVDEDEYPVIINNGRTSVVVSDLAVGTHNLTVNYEGNDKYANSTIETTFKVAKIESKISIDAPDVYAGEDAVITVITPTDANGDVIVTVDGKEYYASVVNGKASVKVSNLDLGTHPVEAVYYGDAQYLSSTNSTTFDVVNKITVKKSEIDVTIEGKVINGILTDADGNPIGDAEINYSINGVNASVKTKADGSFDFETEYGVKTVISYAGNDSYEAFDTSFTIKSAASLRTGTVVLGSNFTQYAIEYNAGERGQNFTVQLKDANGNVLANKTVLIGYNGKILQRATDGDGYASVQINLRDANRLTFAVAFLGDDEFDASMSVYLITINKKPVTISAATKSFKASAKTKKYTVTLSTIKGASADGKTYFAAGKKVTMKINGKTYTAKTNAKGQATFTLKITKKGKYAAAISYAGDTTYNSASKTVKYITIN